MGIVWIWKRSVQDVKDDLADLLDIDDAVFFTIDLQSSDVVLLTSRSWIEHTSVKNDDISDVILGEVGENVEDFSFEADVAAVSLVVEDQISFFQMSGVVKDDFSRLGDSFLLLGDFVVEVVRDRLAREFGNSVSRNTVRSDSNNPVVDGELF